MLISLSINTTGSIAVKLFVISDLHLGGSPHKVTDNGVVGSQICHSYAELTHFIDWVGAQQKGEGTVELVINGDIVDFLMEEDSSSGHEIERVENIKPWLPDEQLIIEKLARIVTRTRKGNSRGPFEAMADLLASNQCLTFVLGNHDIELSLPKVREYLERSVLKSSMNGRFKFLYDGEAYVRGDLLIEHGNRYDRWNVVDHSALRQERSMLSRGFGPEMMQLEYAQFKPPAGSIMVTEVINPIKRKYRFVDLLKPEIKAAVPILLALHPKIEHVLSAITPAYIAKSTTFLKPGVPEQAGQLSFTNANTPFDVRSSLELALGVDDAELFSVSSVSGSQLGVAESWDEIKRLGGHISNWLEDDDNLLKKGATRTRNKLLHKALNAWKGAFALDRHSESSEYLEALNRIAETKRFSCVILGHTHLPKQIMISNDMNYINTGTWADTMRIPERVLAGSEISEEFQEFIENLSNNKIDDYIDRCLTYAEVELEVVGEQERIITSRLCEYTVEAKNAEGF
ncbi:metallophosphoesterase [Vibrio splendidus]